LDYADKEGNPEGVRLWGPRIMVSLKNLVLHASKYCGLFHISRFFTRRGLRILCYHGIALSDENRFRPKLFISPETLTRRFRYLQSKGFPVMSLGEACQALDKDKLPANTVAITMDDGFFGTYKQVKELVEEFKFPITIYVTSYYSANQSPIFRLVVQYMFWKTRTERPDLDFAEYGLRLGRVDDLGELANRDRLMWHIIEHGEKRNSEEERCRLAREIGRRLGVDYDALVRDRRLSLMNSEEITELAERGVDIELHSHRHRFPKNEELAQEELEKNKRFLEPLVGRPLMSFSYPSGHWDEEQLQWLEEMGITSAVTCEPGFNYPGDSKLTLNRFLDGENISQIEFESELHGFLEMLRRCRKCGIRALSLFRRDSAQKYLARS
jgi:peptidoglycan/xylan/chitin deacetylase (PgdA/CDA1 family)